MKHAVHCRAARAVDVRGRLGGFAGGGASDGAGGQAEPGGAALGMSTRNEFAPGVAPNLHASFLRDKNFVPSVRPRR
jgi:hypothetical protein